MATTKFLEPGGDATFALATTNGFWSYFGAQASIVSDFVHGAHQKSIRCAPASSDNGVGTPAATLADAGSRISFYMYMAALPTAANLGIMELTTSGLAQRAAIGISSAGVLKLFSSGTTVIGTGSTLSTGQWYRISIAYTITSTSVNRFEIFVDGVSAISVTNATLGGTGTDRAIFAATSSDTTFDFRISDIYIDDSSSLTDTGNIWVTAKRPNANGSANNFTTQIGSGGSGYGTGHSPQVNERPLSVTNGWSMIGAGSAVTEEYSIEGKSTGDIDISSATIIDFVGWVSAKSLASETASIVVAGVSSNISLTSTTTTFKKVAGSATYPAGGTDIGIVTDTSLTTVSLYEAGILVAYIPTIVSLSVFDSPTVASESFSSALVRQVVIFESITIVDIAGRPIEISIFENVTLSVISNSPSPNVNDSITVAENIALVLKSFISVADTPTITENIATKIVNFISISDSVTITENFSVQAISTFTIFETITIVDISGSPSDLILVLENVSIVEISRGSVSDTVTIAEFISFTTGIVLSIFDSISVMEDVQFQIFDFVNVNETITITETVQFQLIKQINVNDAVTITESLTSNSLNIFSVVDTVSVQDIAGSPADLILITESVNLVVGFFRSLNANDSISISESITLVRSPFQLTTPRLTVMGYYPVGKIGSLPVANIPWTRITHLGYYKLTPNSDGSINTNPGGGGDVTTNMATIVSNGHTNGVKVVIGLGSDNTANDAVWESAVSNANRATFVSNVANFINTWGLDGLDIDWEPFNSSLDAPNFALFVADLRTALGASKSISVFLAGGPAFKPAFANTIQGNIDFISGATYDFSFSEVITIHDAPLFVSDNQPTNETADATTQLFISAGVARNKITIAMTWYAYQWPGETDLYQSATPNNFTAVTYKVLPGASATTPPTGEIFDDVAKAAYTKGDPFTSYNNRATADAKINYVRQQGLQGMIIWEISQAYFSGGSPAFPLFESFPLDADSIGDTAFVSDTATIVIAQAINKSDSVAIIETITMSIVPKTNIFDTITIAEAVGISNLAQVTNFADSWGLRIRDF